MTKRWNKETREQAVRLVLEHSNEYPSKWAAITIVAERLGMSPESLRRRGLIRTSSTSCSGVRWPILRPDT